MAAAVPLLRDYPTPTKMCAYNPGISYDTTSVANGITNAGNSLAQGLQQYRQNKLMTNQAIGQFEAAAQANPDILQFLEKEDGSVPDAVKSAYDSLKSGGSLPIQKAALLSSFASTYGTQKAQAQEMQVRQQQMQLQAMQIKQAQRQYDLLGNLLNAPNGSGSAGGSPPPAGASQFMPVGGQKPDLRSTFINLAQSTGQLPDPKEATAQWRADVDGWNKRSQPIGYVPGGVETDKDGNKVQQYFRILKQNDGTTIQEKEPVKTYAGQPPPGQVLNPDTFTPLPPQAAAAVVGATPGAQPLPPSKDQQEALMDAVNDANTLQVSLQQVGKLQSLNDQLNKNRWSRLAPITGTETGNKAESVIFGDTTGTNFDSAASNLVAGIMGGVKNIRNINEFKAVTGSVPSSKMDADTRGQRITELRNKLVTQLGRTTKAIGNLKAGALPSSAWENASSPDKTVVQASDPKADAANKAFKEGAVYTDASGNKARFTNGQWVPIQ